MRQADFVIAQGDQLPSLVFTAINSAGVKQNLAAATAIVGYMVHLPSGEKITLSVAISDAPNGEITVSWGSTDTALPGLYRVWVVITFPQGTMTFPSCPDGVDEFLVEVCPV